MNPVFWLRLASVLSLLFTAGHTLGGRKSWSPMGETEVLQAMRNVRFTVMGNSRTYLDFYLGFGFMLAVFLLAQAILLWQLGALASSNPGAARPLIGVFVLVSLGSTLLSWRFLFPVPAIFAGVITVCLAIAFFAAA